MRFQYQLDPQYRKKCDEAVNLYKSGFSSTEVAKKYGVHRTTVLSWLRRAGVERRNIQKYNCEIVWDIGWWWESTDISIEELSEMYGISCGNIRRLMVRWGIKRTDRAKRGRFQPKRVVQLDKNGKYIATYESINEASKRTGMSAGRISTLANRSSNHYGEKYGWMKEEEYKEKINENIGVVCGDKKHRKSV